MAYSEKIQFRAFALFLMGESFESIAAVLQREFGVAVAPTTIANWSRKKEERPGFPPRESWEEVRMRATSQAHRTIERISEDHLADLESRTAMLMESLYDDMMGPNGPGVKTKEGGAYAFRSLAEFQLLLRKQKNAHLSPLMIVQALLDALTSVPPIGDAIQKNWHLVGPRIRALLTGDTQEPPQLEGQREP